MRPVSGCVLAQHRSSVVRNSPERTPRGSALCVMAQPLALSLCRRCRRPLRARRPRMLRAFCYALGMSVCLGASLTACASAAPPTAVSTGAEADGLMSTSCLVFAEVILGGDLARPLTPSARQHDVDSIDRAEQAAQGAAALDARWTAAEASLEMLANATRVSDAGAIATAVAKTESACRSRTAGAPTP
jgi:hypothetical protein